MGETRVVATRLTVEELVRLDKALAGSLKGVYTNRAEFIRDVVVLALEGIEEEP